MHNAAYAPSNTSVTSSLTSNSVNEDDYHSALMELSASKSASHASRLSNDIKSLGTIASKQSSKTNNVPQSPIAPSQAVAAPSPQS